MATFFTSSDGRNTYNLDHIIRIWNEEPGHAPSIYWSEESGVDYLTLEETREIIVQVRALELANRRTLTGAQVPATGHQITNQHVADSVVDMEDEDLMHLLGLDTIEALHQQEQVRRETEGMSRDPYNLIPGPAEPGILATHERIISIP